MNYILIITTVNKKKEAEHISAILLKERLIACVQIFPIESRYIWKGKIVKDKEFILLMKSEKKHYKEIETLIKENHSYEIPEIISIDIDRGEFNYLNWIKEVCKK